MKRPSLVLPLILLSTAFYALPTFADPVDPATVGHWERVPSVFAERQKEGAAPGVMEDDLNKLEDGGTTTFNKYGSKMSSRTF